MKYYIIAGEASGDLHGSNLMRGLYKVDNGAYIRFWGGDMMNAVCQENGSRGLLVHHYKDGAVMGLTDVIRKAGMLSRNIRNCKEDILSIAPDVVILIDYPGFNMKIARFCHEHSIKVYYYIAPKTWASRERRNRLLKRYVDKLFIVFPFEIPYFSSRGIPFVYKGNPLIDSVDNAVTSRPCDKPYIAILAGSRKGEISRMMPVCMQVVDKLSSLPRYRDYEFIIAGAPARSLNDYDTGRRGNVRVLFGQTYSVLKYADAAIINSGTASLEAALIGTPQVVCWSTSALTAFAARYILRVMNHIKFISLGNLIIDRLAFRELVQEDFNCTLVSAEVRRLVEDEKYRRAMLESYKDIRSELGGRGASLAVAEAMFSDLNPDSLPG